MLHETAVQSDKAENGQNMLDCGTNLPIGRVSITLIWEYQGVFCYPMFHIVQVRAREIAFVILKERKIGCN